MHGRGGSRIARHEGGAEERGSGGFPLCGEAEGLRSDPGITLRATQWRLVLGVVHSYGLPLLVGASIVAAMGVAHWVQVAATLLVSLIVEGAFGFLFLGPASVIRIRRGVITGPGQLWRQVTMPIEQLDVERSQVCASALAFLGWRRLVPVKGPCTFTCRLWHARSEWQEMLASCGKASAQPA